MRLLLDEMIGPRVAQALRDQGLDAVGVVERTDLRALPDAVLLELAQEDDRVMVTRNIGDFARLDQQWHSSGRAHAGLVFVTEQSFPQNRNLVGALVQALLLAHERSALPGADEVLYLQSIGTSLR